jgi:glutathione S-transferase|nr:glutathione S-transferase family protein [Caldimonas sp.]
MSAPVLVSHALCPYVQRAAIVLAEKGTAFERRWVDLADKPAWFKAVSPLGKTPVLLVGDAALFESAVICEYLDETIAPRLLPDDPLARARERGWIAFASATLDGIAAYYNAADDAALVRRRADIDARFATLDAALGDGPWFAGARFGLVDAAFAPVFRYLDAFERLDGERWLAHAPRAAAWRERLAARRSVRDATVEDYPQRLLAFLAARGSALSRRVAALA